MGPRFVSSLATEKTDILNTLKKRSLQSWENSQKFRIIIKMYQYLWSIKDKKFYIN